MCGWLVGWVRARAYLRTVLRETPSWRAIPRRARPWTRVCCTAFQSANCRGINSRRVGRAVSALLLADWTGSSASNGYALRSIAIMFDRIAITSATSNLTATLNEVSSGDLGSVLCTLEHPDSHTDFALNTYAAPRLVPQARCRNGLFPGHRANGDRYFAIGLDVTAGDNEDSGAAQSWSIRNAGHYYDTAWNTSANAHLIEVKGIVLDIDNEEDATPGGDSRPYDAGNRGRRIRHLRTGAVRRAHRKRHSSDHLRRGPDGLAHQP